MLSAAGQGFAQEDFYKGKTVRIIVGTSAGGGFDTYTRTIARHLGRHIPGQPAIVVVDGACFGLDHLWLVLLHADRGYHIAWAGDRDKFEEMRATFTFTP